MEICVIYYIFEKRYQGLLDSSQHYADSSRFEKNIDRFLHLSEPLFCFPFQTDQLSLSKEIDNSEISLIFFIKVSLNDLLEIVCLGDIFLTDGQKITIKKGSVQGVAVVGKIR